LHIAFDLNQLLKNSFFKSFDQIASMVNIILRTRR